MQSGILMQSDLFLGTCGIFVLTWDIMDHGQYDQYSHICSTSPSFLLPLFGLPFVFRFPCVPFFPFSAIRLSVSEEGLDDVHELSAICSLMLSQQADISSADVSDVPLLTVPLSDCQCLPATMVSHSLSQTCSKLLYCLTWLRMQFLKCMPC